MREKGAIAFLVVAAIILSGCFKPPEGKAKRDNMVEVKPNETAFMVSLEGSQDDQRKLQTVDYWQKAQVSAKRIEVPVKWMKTGRFNHQGEWLPTHRVITVDRTMVSREWTGDANSGTNKTNQSIGLESAESIGFTVNIVMNALIEEKEAATYLYWYGNKPLASVVDENIRNDATAMLSIEFGDKTLSLCRASKGLYVTSVADKLKTKYAEKGITITAFGIQGGLNYEDPKIQDSINELFKSENKHAIATNEKAAQLVENDRLFSIAQNEKSMALERALAMDAYTQARMLDVYDKLAAKWDGTLPTWIMAGPSGSISPILQPPFTTPLK